MDKSRNYKRKRIIGAAVITFITMLLIGAALPASQTSYAIDDDKGAQYLLYFAKINEDGELIDNVTFKFTSSDGKGVRDGYFETYPEIVQTQTTRGQSPSDYNQFPSISFQAVHQWFGVEYPDGSSDFAPFRDLSAYIIMQETDAPEKYALAGPVTIKYAGSTTPDYPYLNYSLTVTGDGGSKTISHIQEYNKTPFCLSEDPGGVATDEYKIKYAHNKRLWPDFLIVNYPKVKISKKDTDGNYLKGAVLEITGTTLKGHAVEKKTITSTSETLELGLPSGTYTLHELSPPEGYELAEDIEFEVNNGVVNVLSKKSSDDGSETVEKQEVSEIVMTDKKIHEPKPLLSVKKTSNVKSAKPGDVIPFVITVTNKGDGDADEVLVLDTMGDTLSYVSDDSGGTTDGQKISWNIKLAAGETKTININCRINESASGKVINNVEITNVKSEYIEPSGGDDSFVLGVYEEEGSEEKEIEEDDGDNEANGDDEVKTKGVATGDSSTSDIIAMFVLSALALAAMAKARKKV